MAIEEEKIKEFEDKYKKILLENPSELVSTMLSTINTNHIRICR